ncbi:MAG: lipocalin family protein [Clostridia bacterium]|nr:lipocalin family protein [Clostridia bacterium]
MKKTMAWLLAVVLLTVCFAACAGSSKPSEPVEIPGTWNLTGAKASGIKVDASQLGFTMSFTFNEDGTAAMTYEGETTDGLNWALDGSVVKLSTHGVDLYDFQFDGSTLTLHEDTENVDLIFGK